MAAVHRLRDTPSASAVRVPVVDRRTRVQAGCALIAQRQSRKLEAQRIIDELVSDHGAVCDYRNGAYQLRFAGLRSTCTSGHNGLLANWTRAATIRLARGEA